MALMESIFELEGLDWGRSRIEDALVIEKSHYQAPNKLIELEKIAVHITGGKWTEAPMTKLPTKELELFFHNHASAFYKESNSFNYSPGPSCWTHNHIKALFPFIGIFRFWRRKDNRLFCGCEDCWPLHLQFMPSSLLISTTEWDYQRNRWFK